MRRKNQSLGKRDVGDEPQGSGGASSWRTPPAPPPPKPRNLSRGQALDPMPEPEPEGTWILKQNKNTRVAVDWHNVMEVNEVVSPKSIAAVQGLLDNGYQVFMVCFCGPHRQHEVHQKVRQLPLEFTSVKYTRARTGATGKAAWSKGLPLYKLAGLLGFPFFFQAKCILTPAAIWLITSPLFLVKRLSLYSLSKG